jgi:broad specificity phosphatase PhoE
LIRLYLVRHGEAAAGWGEDVDPGLSDLGRAQAAAMAESLTESVGSAGLPVVVSPLRRTRQTAAALEASWGVTAVVDARVGEIPSPTLGMSERADWLRPVLSTPSSDWPDDLQPWRGAIAPTVLSFTQDTVIVSHFVFIREVVGDHAFLPANCSITVIEHDGDRWQVVARGAERSTVVL